jgi:hypothetical protein
LGSQTRAASARRPAALVGSDRQIRRLLALENPAAVDAGLAMRIQNVGAVAQQTSRRDEITPLIDRRHCMASCQREKLIAAADEERLRGDRPNTMQF